MDAGRLAGIRKEHPLAAWSLAWAAFIGLVGLLVGLGLLIDRSATLAFLWTDLVGPWVAEATHQPSASWNGHVATTGYTLALEGFYVVLVLYAMVTAWYLVAEPLGLPLARRLIYAITPGALAGTVARVLEDGLVFCRAGTVAGTACQAGPWSYLAISPLNFVLIYFMIVPLAGVAARAAAGSRRTHRRRFRYLIAAQAALFFLLVLVGRSWTAISLWWAPLLMVLADPVHAWALDRGWRPTEATVLASTTGWLAISVAYLTVWLADPLIATTRHLDYAVWVIAATGLATGAVVIVVRAFSGTRERLAALAGGIGAWIIGSHMLDAFATFLGICTPTSTLCNGASFTGLTLAGYGEKHPVSAFLLGHLDGWAYPLVKLLVPAVFLLAAADHLGDEDREHTIGIYLLIIWYAGLVPGLRNMLRGMMGI